MKVNEYLNKTKPGYYGVRDRIVCKDGFSMSVQAGSSKYCEPRNDYGPWVSAEIGFPSEEEPLIMEWAESPDNPTGTVYGGVPLEVIDTVIEKHGGWK